MKTTILSFLFQFLAFQIIYAQVWAPLGNGVTAEHKNDYAKVNTFSEDTVNHLLYVGGDFYYAGDTVSRYLAIWNGIEWHTVESGDISISGPVTGSYMLHDTVLYSNSHGIGRFHNHKFLEDLPGVGGAVRAFMMYHDTLFAAGSFFGGIKKYNGKKWEIVGGGVYNAYDLCIYNDQLIVGGSFTEAGDSVAHDIAAWDGNTWHSLGSGTKYNQFQTSGIIEALTVYNNTIIAGGLFDHAGDSTAHYVAQWDGVTWHPMDGLCDEVVDLFSDGKHGVYACGWFGMNKSGKCAANRVAYWNGSEWSDLDFGEIDPVFCMNFFDNDLYVGGIFTRAGDVDANHIARLENAIATSSPSITHNQTLDFYPNPATDQLHIETPNIHNATVTILNLLGQVVLQQEFSDNGLFDISNLPKGMYLVNIMDGIGKVLKKGKVVKE
ncbi:MAG: T9SS type A sorting domain-containing protein [Chitinophagales bacterium]|nr:T9SS type A sorting domain-containing protein [Chitinophagales bacterium]